MRPEIESLIKTGWDLVDEKDNLFLLKRGLVSLSMCILINGRVAVEEPGDEICVHRIDTKTGINDTDLMVCLEDIRKIAAIYNENIIFSAGRYARMIYGERNKSTKDLDDIYKKKSFSDIVKYYNDNGYTLIAKGGYPFFLGVDRTRKNMHIPISPDLTHSLYQFMYSFSTLSIREFNPLDIAEEIDEAFAEAVNSQEPNYRRALIIISYLESLYNMYDKFKFDFDRDELKAIINLLENNRIIKMLRKR